MSGVDEGVLEFICKRLWGYVRQTRLGTTV